SFGFEKLKVFDSKLWNEIRKHKPEPPKHPLQLFGSDNDPRALTEAKRTIAAAGVDRWVKLERADVLDRAAPADAGVMIANPPYGERIGSSEELARFYPMLGNALKKNFAGWRCHFFTADLRLAKMIRLEASRRTVLWNGALECRLYEFKIVAGSNRR